MPSKLWSDRALDVYVGDCRDVLAELPAESVHSVVTSPPYWGLRDYTLAEDEAGRRPLGLEDDPDDFVGAMVDVFRAVARVLRRDGTLWLNLGDTYGGTSGASTPKGLSAAADRSDPREGSRELNRAERGETPYAPRIRRGLRSKDLAGIPWRVALALQADGWYLRADIIWHKPNPMPSSTTDRPTVAHEYLFLLARSPRYYYDADAVRETTGREATWDEWAAADGRVADFDRDTYLRLGQTATFGAKRDSITHPLGRNLRTVWTIATQPYRDAHYATFPEALVEPCVLAGTSAYGVCETCGAPWRRVVEVDYRSHGAGKSFATNWSGGKRADGAFGPSPGEKTLTPEAVAAGQAPGPQGMPHGRADKLVETVGWRPGCEHGGLVIPATVLDPFAGSGTSGLVAQRLGRRAILIDAKGDYLAGQAMRRNEQMPLGLVGSSTTKYGNAEASTE